MPEVPAPAAAPVIPEPPTPAPAPQDFLEHLDDGGQAAADFDDEFDHDRDGPISATPPPPPSPSPVSPAAVVPPTVPPAPAEPPKVVPIAELIAERVKRQTLERQIEALQQQPVQPLAPVQPPEPDIDYLEDPKGYVDQQVKRAIAQLAKPVEQVQQQSQLTAQEVNQQRAMQQFTANIQANEAGFVQQTPDYFEALNHLRTVRIGELKVFAPEATDEQLMNYVRVEELRGAAAVMQTGRNPAQVAYEFAKLRGYRKPVPNGQGGPPQAPDRDQARGLPSGGGQPPEGLQPSGDTGNVMPEFTAALRERFGIGR